MLDTLRGDFARLPEILGRQLEPPEPPPAATALAPAPEPAAVQLGLF
jgi:hypothetical protein